VSTTLAREDELHDREPAPPDRLLVAKEIADLLAVPESWVRQATRSEGLPHIRLGRYVRYEWGAVAAWLDQRWTGRLPLPQSGTGGHGSALGSRPRKR
jgi:excisionase family DNA binding protein